MTASHKLIIEGVSVHKREGVYYVRPVIKYVRPAAAHTISGKVEVFLYWAFHHPETV